MRRAQVWTSRNMWGEAERWYRLPVRVQASTLVDLAGTVDELEGPWTRVLRAEVWTALGRAWLTAHQDGHLICVTTDADERVLAEVDQRIAASFGTLVDLGDLAQPERMAA